MTILWSPTLIDRGPRYNAIVEALADDIANGRLRPGDRLPTQRELADQLGISVGTVTRAFAAAERRGLLRGETGRGTFVSAPVSATYAVTDVPDAAPGLIDLGVTWPLYSDDPDLAPVLRRVARSPDLRELLQYQPNAGMSRHREAGAAWMARCGLETSAERVLVTAGTQHALNVVLATMCEPGDTLLVEEFTYPGITALAGLLKLKLAPVAGDAEGLLPEAFESACRQRHGKVLYCVPTIQNPTATTLPEMRRREVAAIAERYGVTIIEDGVHQLLAQEPPAPMACYSENACFIGSLSKVVSGALRIAFLAVPVRLVERIAHAIWATNWMAAPLCAEITALWIEDGTAGATVQRKQAEARERLEIALRVLDGISFQWSPWGHHVWLGLPAPWQDASRFAAHSRRRGVAVTADDAFLAGGSARGAWIRLSLSAPASRETLEIGLEKLRTLLCEPPPMNPAIV